MTDKQPIFKCSECGKEYKYETSYIQHLKKIHSVETASTDNIHNTNNHTDDVNVLVIDSINKQDLESEDPNDIQQFSSKPLNITQPQKYDK